VVPAIRDISPYMGADTEPHDQGQRQTNRTWSRGCLVDAFVERWGLAEQPRKGGVEPDVTGLGIAG
jgi:hypothetical protein